MNVEHPSKAPNSSEMGIFAADEWRKVRAGNAGKAQRFFVYEPMGNEPFVNSHVYEFVLQIQMNLMSRQIRSRMGEWDYTADGNNASQEVR